jgi:hypothetical protein
LSRIATTCGGTPATSETVEQDRISLENTKTAIVVELVPLEPKPAKKVTYQ